MVFDTTTVTAMSHCRALSRPCLRNLLPPRPQHPILPFLYQTRSLRLYDDGDVPLEDPGADPWGYLYPTETINYTQRPTPAPSSSTYHPLRFSDDVVAAPITMREKEVFSTIFKDLLNRTGEKPLADRKLSATYSQRHFNRDNLPYTQPPHVLTDMLNDPGSSSISFAPHTSIDAFPESLRQMAASVARRSMAPSIPAAKPDSPELVSKRKELQETEGDLETLKWMEENVFGLLQEDPEVAAEMYPELLYTGLQMFAEEYDDFATVQALFHRAKSLGADSYVLGCTTKVYNLIISVLWRGLHDARRVWELIEEMDINGIEPDIETKRVVQKILGAIEAHKQGVYGQVGKLWVDDGQLEYQKRLRHALEKWALV